MNKKQRTAFNKKKKEERPPIERIYAGKNWVGAYTHETAHQREVRYQKNNKGRVAHTSIGRGSGALDCCSRDDMP